MAPELKKPYRLQDIAKRPFAVVISILIGLLSTSVGYNLTANSRADSKVEKKQLELDQVRTHMEVEKDKRIQMYENMLFYKAKSEHLEHHSDSLVRVKTEPFVNKIFSNDKK